MAKTKTKKPLLIRILNKIMATILVFAILFGAVYAFVLVKYDIDLIKTIKQVNGLMKPVDESIFVHKYSDEDMQSFRQEFKDACAISIDLEDDDLEDQIVGAVMPITQSVYLTGEECAAFIGNLIQEYSTDDVEMANNTMSYSFIQMTFDNVNESEHSAEVTVVLKLDISNIKSQMKTFPANLIANKITNYLYISATAKVTRDATLPFSYSLESKGLTINALNQEDTKQMLGILNKFTSIGEAEDLALNIAKPFVGGLIATLNDDGTIKEVGLASSYSTKNAKNYDIVTVDGTNYFVIEKAL